MMRKSFICLIVLAGSGLNGALVEEPLFKYRCAERAFQMADYPVAQKFYGEIVTDSPPLKLAALRGMLDSMLCMGQWTAAGQCVDANDFSQFENMPGYGELMLRVCFALVKNRRFASAENILARIDFVHLRDGVRPWYHSLNSLVLRDGRKFKKSEVELDLARTYAQSAEQLWLINLFNLQSIVAEMGSDTNAVALESLLKDQIATCKDGQCLCDAVKLYSLFLNNVGRRVEALKALEECGREVCGVDDVHAMGLYRALISGILSRAGLAEVKCVLLGNCGIDAKLLAFKLLINSVKSNADATLAANFLDSVLANTGLDWLRRSIYLAKIAIFLNVERFDSCSAVASEYVNSFSADEFFGNIYELLAHIALGGHALEYRNSAHYLDKLRASVSDNGLRVALTLKIADAFFYNRDFRLASDMYGEVLKLNSVEKCGHALVNQVISDVALGHYGEASAHITSANGGLHEKLDAIVEYLSALKRSGMCGEALEYIDSLELKNVPDFVKYTLAVSKAEFLLKRKQYAQALILSSKICDKLLGKIGPREHSEICAKALSIKGCAAYELKDFEAGSYAFNLLRSKFRKTKHFTPSLFREANVLRRCGDVEKAISVLEMCSDAKYLPHANYRIALLKLHFGQVRAAAELLEQIISDNPEGEIAVAVRIAQGDILRAMGDFANAQLMYEHASRFASKISDANYLTLARAKCLIAQKNRDPKCLETAANILRDLYSSAGQSTSFRLECVAQYCLALKLQNECEDLKKFAFEVLANVDNSGIELGKKSRYWLLQTLFILRDSAQCSRDEGKLVESLIAKYNVDSDD